MSVNQQILEHARCFESLKVFMEENYRSSLYRTSLIEGEFRRVQQHLVDCETLRAQFLQEQQVGRHMRGWVEVRVQESERRVAELEQFVQQREGARELEVARLREKNQALVQICGDLQSQWRGWFGDRGG